jgi:Transglutaminase-like superfamily/TgpA N-terminal domain
VRRARPTFVRSMLALALAGALAALALSLRESILFLPLALFGAAALATPFVEWTSVPARLPRALPRAHAFALVIAALGAWFSRSMGVLVLPPDAIPFAAAPVLLPVWAAFALAPRAFPGGRTLVPGIVGALTLAGLNPAPAGYGGSRLPFLQGADRNGFAEVYLALAILVVAALWVAALGGAGPRWSRRTVAVVTLACGLAVGLAATGVIGLPLAQPHVEKAFAAALDQGTTGLSGESRLGDIGALSPSRRRVLDLQTSLPSGGHWRLPSEVFTRFDGRRWTNGPPPRRVGPGRGPSASPGGPPSPAGSVRPSVLRPEAPPAGAGPLVAGLGAWFPGPGAPAGGSAAEASAAGVRMRVTQAEVADWPLLLPRGVVAVTAHASYLDLDRFRLVRRPRGLPLRQYGAVVAAAPPVPGEEAADLSPDERAESLSLPSAVDPRVVSLAERLAAPSAEPRDRLTATLRHLQTGYRYTLSPGPFRPDGDPLAEFLFEKRAAYCEYFATAAVVLLRLEGVPARFVKGLSVGAQTDVGGGLYVVRESDAHAWIEAWIPGEGWVEADPTPPGEFASARGTPGRWRRSFEHARAAASEAWRRLTEGGPLAFLRWAVGALVSLAGRLVRSPLAWLLAAAVVLGPRLLRRLRRLLRAGSRSRHDEASVVPADLRALVRDVERLWAAHGHPRPRGRGLLEHACALGGAPPPGRPSLPASLVESSGRIVREYYRARFGGEVLSAEEVRWLRDRL